MFEEDIRESGAQRRTYGCSNTIRKFEALIIKFTKIRQNTRFKKANEIIDYLFGIGTLLKQLPSNSNRWAMRDTRVQTNIARIGTWITLTVPNQFNRVPRI